MESTGGRAARTRRCRGEDGAALVEFSLVVGLLMLFLYGIIAFGLSLAVKESVTQAAADAARAGMTAKDPVGAANSAVDNAIGWLGKCGDGSFNCDASIITANTPGCDNSTNNCIRVKVTYDWKDHPVVPNLPGLGLILPDSIPAQSVDELAHP